MALSDSHQESGNAPYLLFILTFCREKYTLEDTGGQSRPKYIELKRENPQVCLIRVVFAPVP